jgi:hypothetical protein
MPRVNTKNKITGSGQRHPVYGLQERRVAPSGRRSVLCLLLQLPHNGLLGISYTLAASTQHVGYFSDDKFSR